MHKVRTRKELVPNTFDNKIKENKKGIEIRVWSQKRADVHHARDEHSRQSRVYRAWKLENP